VAPEIRGVANEGRERGEGRPEIDLVTVDASSFSKRRLQSTFLSGKIRR
jgi:hypothetical protein